MNKNLCILIEDAGVNHDDDFELAPAAAQVGGDNVKFQTFKANSIVSTNAKKAVYKHLNIIDGDIS